ncbi:hypothetical protein [Oceanirhabdus seepicola]|uniref:Lipoprotein n=1 Tax=Oceanirhabdus seepicola TaxID=2828781 RepID=A0A9J6NVU3_9CLOT|nr:hypothetical protein [Oceanirhabdus seepicola]MCM1988172.1 hypothetical protein [Oceanirhabdus seepicola]
MRKTLIKGTLISLIMLFLLTTCNVFADDSEKNSEINFKKIKSEIEEMKKNQFNNWNNNCNNNWNNNCNNNWKNWGGQTVKTLGNRFTRDNKAIISGMFNDIDNDEVRDYGFFIGNEEENLTKKISLREEDRQSGFMDYEIDFETGKTYYYQAFIEYEDEIIKGEVHWFHKGSNEEFNKNLYQNKFGNWNNNWNNNRNNNWDGNNVNTFGNRFAQDNKVIISGMFNDIDNNEVLDYGFFIGNDKDNLTKKISIKEKNRHNGFRDYEIDNVEKGKTYYYQAFIEYDDEITKGVILGFCMEKQEGLEVVTVNALNGYEKNTVLFIGKCENMNSMRSYKYGFYWGYSKDELSTKSYYDNQRDDYFIQSIKDVNEGTIYYQTFVECNGVIVKGELKSFEFKKNLNN